MQLELQENQSGTIYDVCSDFTNKNDLYISVTLVNVNKSIADETHVIVVPTNHVQDGSSSSSSSSDQVKQRKTVRISNSEVETQDAAAVDKRPPEETPVIVVPIHHSRNSKVAQARQSKAVKIQDSEVETTGELYPAIPIQETSAQDVDVTLQVDKEHRRTAKVKVSVSEFSNKNNDFNEKSHEPSCNKDYSAPAEDVYQSIRETKDEYDCARSASKPKPSEFCPLFFFFFQRCNKIREK